MIAPHPLNEADRLEVLRSYGILDTPPESQYDDLVRLAATICRAPLASVTFVDTCRQWFKSRLGLDADETPREYAFCSHAILNDDLFVVSDAADDERFRDNPFVIGAPHIRFYAGMPLSTPEGHNIGTLCVIDRVPRTLTAEQEDVLRVLGRQVVAQLLLRREVERAKVVEADLRVSDRKFRAIFDTMFEFVGLLSPDGVIREMNRTAAEAMGLSPSDVIGLSFPETPWWTHDPANQARLRDAIRRAAGGEFVRFDTTVPLSDGSIATIDFSLKPVFDEDGAVVLLVPEGRDVTEKRKVEDALRESEERFRAFMDNSPITAFMKDEAGRYTYINESVVKRFGMPMDAWLGKTDEALFPAEYSATWRENDRNVLAGGKVVECNESAPMADGTISYWSAYKFPFRDAAGRLHLAGIGLDVTAKKLAEDALRESEERFRAFMDNSPALVFVKDEAGRFTYLNESFSRRLSAAPERWLGKTDFDVWPKDVAQQFHDNDARVRAGGVPVRLIETTPGRDGSLTHWHVHKFPFANAGGKPFLAGLAVDMTAEKKVEDALRSSEAKFRGIVDRLAEGVLIIDPATGCFIEANTALLAMLGYSLAEFVDLDAFDIVAGETSDVFARNIEEMHARLEREGRCDVGRKQFRRKDGSVVPVDLRVTVIPDGAAGLHAVIVRDVSEEAEYQNRVFEYQLGLEEANAKLKALAVTDGLTRVRNRAAFDAKLAEEHDRATRYGHPLAVVLMDVDHFKLFNDTFGHPAGDEVLRAVARVLQETARTMDFVARYGGEEFAVILPDTEHSGAMVLAERLRRAVADQRWDKRAVTVSVGVALLTPATADAAELVRQADEALYRSKQAGRNRVSNGTAAASKGATSFSLQTLASYA